MSHALISTLKTLVSYQTDALALGNKEACMAFVEDSLRSYGWHTERFASSGIPSVVSTTQKGKSPKILLAAHLDVVPGKPGQFDMRERDCRLYGRLA